MTNEAQHSRGRRRTGRRSQARREREVAVIRHFRTVVKAIQAHSTWVERQCGVSAAQLWALWEIHAEPGLRVKDISERLSIKPATASNLLDKIEGKELIRRDRCGPDQRVVQLFPTERGEQLLASAPGPAEGALLNALARLDDLKLGELAISLDALVEAFAIRGDEFAMAPIPPHVDESGDNDKFRAT
ncbi:MAG: MarR family transcriptional regulator [Wenzhouxiangella sp.]|nr:MarR family transcriptional regulator [Wenzhouxiangella sp.]